MLRFEIVYDSLMVYNRFEGVKTPSKGRPLVAENDDRTVRLTNISIIEYSGTAGL